ncbi:MAG: glycosyltransferase family 2 protein [Actinomycetota bacterium]|nr:glycosyltransferase family 2 protein [Actinomycetota bacterium]
MKIRKVSIVVPAYNEEEAIGGDLEAILESMDKSEWEYEVIVVNDGSNDKTADIVGGFDRVRLIEHNSNRGGGYARNTGIKASTGDVVVVTDGDGTYPNEDIPKLLRLMEDNDFDMVVGSRIKEAGTLKFLRTPAKWFIRKLASFMSGFSIPDLNSGFRAIKKDVFMQYMELLPWGHSWVSTITLAMLSEGHDVGYLDIDYFSRKGKSTFHPIKDTYSYLMLVIRTITWFNPLRVFMPIAFALGLIGFIKLILDVITPGVPITTATVVLILTSIQIAVLGLLADLIVKRR